MKELADAGAIGDVKTVISDLSTVIPEEKAPRLHRALVFSCSLGACSVQSFRYELLGILVFVLHDIPSQLGTRTSRTSALYDLTAVGPPFQAFGQSFKHLPI